MNQRDLGRKAYWRKVIQEQKASGCSISDFCRNRGISDASFYRWRKRLDKHQTPLAQDTSKVASQAEFKDGFFEIDMTQVVESRFEVTLGNGRSISVPAHFHSDSLRQLIDLLEAESC